MRARAEASAAYLGSVSLRRPARGCGDIDEHVRRRSGSWLLPCGRCLTALRTDRSPVNPGQPDRSPGSGTKSPGATRRIGRSTLRRSNALVRMRAGVEQSLDRGRMLKTVLFARNPAQEVKEPFRHPAGCRWMSMGASSRFALMNGPSPERAATTKLRRKRTVGERDKTAYDRDHPQELKRAL